MFSKVAKLDTLPTSELHHLDQCAESAGALVPSEKLCTAHRCAWSGEMCQRDVQRATCLERRDVPGRCAKSHVQEGICQSDVQRAMCQSNVQRVGNIVPEEESPRKDMPVSRKAVHPLC